MPWPCGVSYRVTQGHNMGSHVGTYNAWAWDFGIPVGGEVSTPAPGTVRHVRMNSTVGGCNSAYAADANYIVIDFGDGTSASFTHLQANSTTLKVGDRVEQGDVVGRVGLSGWVCGAHLHFSIVETCGSPSCPTIPASFVDFGDPMSGTITSNNCGGGHPAYALEAHHYSNTNSDIDGDGRADLCGRSSEGVFCRLSSGDTLATEIAGPSLTDANGWDVANLYSTIRMADVTGDGLADVCARAPAGFRCWPSMGNSFGPRFELDDLKDAGNWNRPEYYTTIRMPDFNGDGLADLCARGGSGIRCWPSTGTGFGEAVTGPPMSDAYGWQFPEFYTTIRTGDVNGDGLDDVCGRSSDFYHCWLGDGSAFPTLVDGPDWTDAGGWTRPRYYRTIRLADIDADGDLDVCARTSQDFRCHRWTGDDFEDTPIIGPLLSDESGWAQEDNFSTIRMGDIDGDGDDDVCARANNGMLCWKANGSSFDADPISGPDYSDAAGFDDPSQFRTITLGDVNGDGMADICGRETIGFRCWLSNGDGFPTVVPGRSWSSDAGWDEPQYYATLRLGGPPVPPCEPEAEVCDGVDNDCDDAVDEDDVCVSPGLDPNPPGPGDGDMGGSGGDAGGSAEDGGPGPGGVDATGGCNCGIASGFQPEGWLWAAVVLCGARRRRKLRQI